MRKNEERQLAEGSILVINAIKPSSGLISDDDGDPEVFES